LGPSDSLSDYPQFAGNPGGAEKILVQIGRSIGVRLTDGRIAKLRPVEIDRSDNSVRVEFEYVYQPVAGETLF
jgi:hypothetical protein